MPTELASICGAPGLVMCESLFPGIGAEPYFRCYRLWCERARVTATRLAESRGSLAHQHRRAPRRN